MSSSIVFNPLSGTFDFVGSSGGGSSPAGSSSWVQYNDSGSFGADADFTRDPANNYQTNVEINLTVSSGIARYRLGVLDLELFPGTITGSFNSIYNSTDSIFSFCGVGGNLADLNIPAESVVLAHLSSNGSSSIIIRDDGTDPVVQIDTTKLILSSPDINVPDLSADTVPYVNSGNNLRSSSVTPTELGYVHGVTSAIQTQLNSKIPSIADPNADVLFGWDDTDNDYRFITIGTGLSYDHSTHTLSNSGSSFPISLSDGGTGSSLSDPGVDALFGWDSTDVAASFFSLGSGLSYDHATHTLSSTAGNPVGADKDIQFNDAGVFGGDDDFQWDKVAKVLFINGNVNIVRNPFYIGTSALLSGSESLSLGFNLTANGNDSVAIGRDSQVNGNSGIAIGQTSNAVDGSIAIGAIATAVNSQGISIGTLTSAGDHGVAVGPGSAAGDHGVALGFAAQATGASSTSILGTCNGDHGICILGYVDIAADYGLAFGSNARAMVTGSFALCQNALAEEHYALAIGTNTTASGNSCAVFGKDSSADSASQYGVILGIGCTITASATVAIGYQATSTKDWAVAIGPLSSSLGIFDVAIGYQAKVDTGSEYSIAMGYQASVTGGSYSGAFGYNTQVIGNLSYAMGFSAAISADDAVAIGVNATVIGNSGVALGLNSLASDGCFSALGVSRGASSVAILGFIDNGISDGVAIGVNSQVYATGGFALCQNATTNGAYDLAIGTNAIASGGSSTAIGNSCSTDSTSQYSIAIGTSSAITNQASIAIGFNVAVSGGFSAAIGPNNTLSGFTSYILGGSCTVTHDDSVAIGKFASTTSPNQFMVGGTINKLNTIIHGNLRVNIDQDNVDSIFLGMTDANLLYVSGITDTIGIGTNSPDEKLHVVGNTKVTGTMASYNGDTTAGNGLSSVISSVALTAQTASISATTLYSPVTTGTFRVSIYAVDTAAGAAGTLTVSISWTDDQQPQTFTTSTLSLAVLGGYLQQTIFIEAKNTADIKYSTTVASVVGSPKYSLYIITERLS